MNGGIWLAIGTLLLGGLITLVYKTIQWSIGEMWNQSVDQAIREFADQETTIESNRECIQKILRRQARHDERIKSLRDDIDQIKDQ